MGLQTVPPLVVRPQPPATVIAAAVICFADALFYALGMLFGVLVTAWSITSGAALYGGDRGTGDSPSSFVGAGVVIGAVCLVLALLYVLGGTGLLLRSRPGYLAVLLLLGFGIVASGVVAAAGLLFLQIGTLVWPLANAAALLLLTLVPQGRTWFADPRAPSALLDRIHGGFTRIG